ncbi:uncharacterized protein LOC131429448 [Malaya genurostris]|uniref:uncharacterized protein LOC131429448 n=1 Tax=Malaya genurostris TaxID=325434 RepID=UPI0026F3C3B9|nr:uncharacterized protein LOC131429448 [Malaya genurostris]
MNSNPGVTLFNDGGSIQVNNASALQRAEEEEALEDQKRRQVELAKQMENAFDDLIDDDDQNDTLNSLNYLSNYSEQPAESPPPPPLPIVGGSPRQRFLEDAGATNGPLSGGGDSRYNHEVAHWKNMFESKSREFEHVTRLLHDKTKEFEQEKGELQKRLMLAEGERDRANMTRTQTHDLLVASKTKISEQEDVIGKLRTKIKSLEDTNLKLEAELENKKTMLQDTLHKYHMVEQNIGLKADRYTDQLLKQSEEKHNAKVTMMQQQIDNLRSDLDDRVQEVRRLEVRYKELQSLRDTLVVEKSETIQRLQDNLEESQRHCENLMAKTTNLTGFSQDNLRLKTKVNALEQQTQDMQRTINMLTHRLETTNAELELMDSLVCAKDETGELAGESGCNFAVTRKNLVGSTPINPSMKNTEERVTKLKHELLICMNGQKEKREAIKKLEADVASRDKEIQQLKKDESMALVQMNQYKEEAFRVSSKLKILENELEKYYKKEQHTSKQGRRSSYDKQDVLEDKIFALKQEKVELEEKLTRLENEYRKLEEINKKFETDSKSFDGVKLELEKQKFLLKDAQSECERLKNLYIEMSSCKDNVCRELEALKRKDTEKELSILHEKVASLERALQLAELKASELSKMLEKEKLDHEKLLKDLSERRENDREAKDPNKSTNSCERCVENLTEMSKVEIQNLQLQNTCASHLREINELKNALHKSRATINDLNNKLDLKAERDYLIDELKQKAVQFEEFMRNQHANNSNTSSGNSSTKDCATSPLPQHPSRDQSVGTSPELLERTEQESRKVAREQEHRIREEMARAFAAEMKIIEEKFKTQFRKFEENISALKNELHDRVNELLTRSKEVEVLKFAIKAEREKMAEMLAKKDNDARLLFDKQAEVMKKYKAELNNAQQKVQFLEGELQEKRELIQSERESMAMLTKQITDERKMFHERESEVIEKFKEIEEEYNKSLEMVTEKYNSVKKTALNYKKYAEDKEQHMLKEYDRIKEGYNTALLKVQNRMKEALESKDRSMKEHISKLEADYRSKINALKGTA